MFECLSEQVGWELAKATRFLIDGYNLLFAAGWQGRARGTAWLNRARLRLITHLQAHIADAYQARTVIVFDAAKSNLSSRQDAIAEMNAANPHFEVLFSEPPDEADDVLERLIDSHSAPKTLTVVSSDHRVQRKAMARRCRAIDCTVFLDQLEKGQFLRADSGKESHQEAIDKPIADGSDVDRWMREFGL